MENNKNIKPIVMESYKKIAVESSNCCGDNISKSIGYSEEELEIVPKDSNLGLGCGNPQLIANICEGETVLDLGSGAGFDCFLASKKVGDSGQVIGVDMTFEMVTKARNNAYENNYNNVDFRLGEIENLPVADNSVDVIMDFDLEPIYVKDRPKEVKKAMCSSDKARKLLGYSTKVSLREGLMQMVENIKKLGPKEFIYNYPIEINNENTPETWKNKLI